MSSSVVVTAYCSKEVIIISSSNFFFQKLCPKNGGTMAFPNVGNYRVNIKSFPDYKHLLQENYCTWNTNMYIYIYIYILGVCDRAS